MHRQIALDTETTGMLTEQGTVGEQRIIEIGCVEILDRKLTGRYLQFYVNPQRPVDEGAVKVHGITDEFLKDKPTFDQIGQELIDFIRGSELLIHNANFDVPFLDMEWTRMGVTQKTTDFATVLDTLKLASELNPGRQVNLNHLCDLYDVDRSSRTMHGALLDAQLLAEVYLSMTRNQVGIEFEGFENTTTHTEHKTYVRQQGQHLPKMKVEPWRLATHKAQLLNMALQHKVKDADEQLGAIGGVRYGTEFNLELIKKDKTEDDADFAQRKKQYVQQHLARLVSADEFKLYQQADQQLQQNYEQWVSRVLGKSKP